MADGNALLKNLKMRLDVRLYILHLRIVWAHVSIVVLPHAPEIPRLGCYRSFGSNYALRQTLLPLLRIVSSLLPSCANVNLLPFQFSVILGGIDRDGTGAVYGFDPVGSYERESCRAAGSAQSLIQPFLDNQVCIIS